ncbi:ABC transporter permease [Longispora urticae]
MTPIAWATLRARWVTFVSTFVALTLSVALVSAMGLMLGATLNLPDRGAERFGTAPAVVYATDPTWDPALHDPGTRSLAAAKGVDKDLVATLQGQGRTVLDRSFYAQVSGQRTRPGLAPLGHAWSVAEFGGYTLAAGRAPDAADEIATAGGNVGEKVTVLTAEEAKSYTVVGVTKAVGFEQAVFFSESEAARLSPRVEAVVSFAPVDTLRSTVGDRALVLTGDDRHKADPSVAGDRDAMDNTETLLPITASVAGFVSIFVVASTFAFAVVQRRREVALLRTVGATPKQVRRMLLAEAGLLGTVASLLGCVLGYLAAPLMTSWWIRLGISPEWFAVDSSFSFYVWGPLVGAFLVGLAVALVGVWSASLRAARVRPVDALREASADTGGMTRGRLVFGLTGLGIGLLAVALIGFVAPDLVLIPNAYVPILLVPILALALLAPIAVGPIVKLLTWPLGGLKGAGAMLVREGTLTATRRTAATAAPVLLTLGLSLSLLGATETVNEARDTALRSEVKADYVVYPDGTPGVSRAVVDRLTAVQGVDVIAPIMTMLYIVEPDGGLDENDGQAVDPAQLAKTVELPVAEGSLSDLRDDTIVVPDLWGKDMGESLDIQMGDGTRVSLKVVAIVKATPGNDIAYLSMKYADTAKYARTGLARRAQIRIHPDADRPAVDAALQQAITGSGTKLWAASAWVGNETAEARKINSLRQQVVLGIVVLFCFIAIVNTLMMATADRRRDLAVLRLTGATPKQALRVFAAESLLVCAVGFTLAALAALVNLIGLRFALTSLFGSTPIVVPWGPVVLIGGISVVLALLGTVLPAALALRTPSVELAGVRE